MLSKLLGGWNNINNAEDVTPTTVDAKEISDAKRRLG